MIQLDYEPTDRAEDPRPFLKRMIHAMRPRLFISNEAANRRRSVSPRELRELQELRDLVDELKGEA